MNNNLVRIKREVEKLTNKPPPGITCYPTDKTLTNLTASICGSHGTPYESGVFDISIEMPANYPFSPPRVRFLTKVYHPNIDEAGRICLDILKVQPEGTWRPTYTIESVLIAIQVLLNQPNPDNPLVSDIASEYKFNKLSFDRTAKEWTVKYAGTLRYGLLVGRFLPVVVLLTTCSHLAFAIWVYDQTDAFGKESLIECLRKG